MLLGLAGDYTSPEAGPSHYATKAGGLAWLPGTAPPPGSDNVCCRICTNQMALVVQVRDCLARPVCSRTLPPYLERQAA